MPKEYVLPECEYNHSYINVIFSYFWFRTSQPNFVDIIPQGQPLPTFHGGAALFIILCGMNFKGAQAIQCRTMDDMIDYVNTTG